MRSLTPRGAAMAAGLVMLAACAVETPTDPINHAMAPTGAELARADQANAGKVDICHIQGNGDYHLINVSGNAQPAHMAHGDGLPETAVPGGEGTILDASCAIAETTPATCLDYFSADQCQAYFPDFDWGDGSSDCDSHDPNEVCWDGDGVPTPPDTTSAPPLIP